MVAWVKLRIEDIDFAKDFLPKKIGDFCAKNRGVYLQDIRLEADEGKAVYAMKGNAKAAREESAASIGVRTFAINNGLAAGGFIGASLSKAQLEKLPKILLELQKVSYKRAIANAANKAKLKKRHKLFGNSINSTSLAEVEVCVDTVKPDFKKNPRDLALDTLVERIEKCSQTVQKISGIESNQMSAVTGLERQIFASSEGALIDQAKAFTQSFIFVAAKGKAIDTFYEWNGAYAGTEVLDGENTFQMKLEDFAEYVAKGTVEVANAPAMKTIAEEATVVTDPRYNALLSHEITGHPSEADRALKREAAWAGRAWWYHGVDDNYFGKQVASDHVSVFSDPSLQGYGNYKYDDEGVKGKRVYHIKSGFLNEFLNSRETAKILDKSPNGGMRASSADVMPLIRMNNTCFDKGDWTKDEIIRETRDGYYAVGQRTPSIGETRQNFRITCWKLYKIENGEIKQLYRSGGLTSDSHKFLMSIDAAADDFYVHNIPNCGKGTPMQTMRVGNGGPHLRGKAIVTGLNVEDFGTRDNFAIAKKMHELNFSFIGARLKI